MKRGVRVLFICLLLILPGLSTLGQSFQQAESWLFSFPEGEDLLLADYSENARELQRMRESLRGDRVPLLEGTQHLLLVSHLSPHQATDVEALNEASLRASRLRAYLKQKLNLPHECVVFYIDRSGHNSNQLHVYKVSAPLPWFANQEISYSESRYTKSLEEAVSRYGAIPFVDLYRFIEGETYERVIYRISDALFERAELDDYRLQTGKRPAPAKNVTTTIITKTTTRRTQPALVQEEQQQVAVRPEPQPAAKEPQSPHSMRGRKNTAPIPEVSHASGAQPFNLAIKTNLLPWCTLSPSILLGSGSIDYPRGSFMPNVEVEYYFANRWSVALSGLYAYYTYGNLPDNLWGVSALTLEPRCYLLADNQFRGVWFGAFGQYGDFDVKGEKISAEGLYGRTGRYLSGGLSIGGLLPLGAGFCLEGVVQAGYRSVYDGKRYRYDATDNKNYRESTFSATGMLVGFRLNVAYRFGFK